MFLLLWWFVVGVWVLPRWFPDADAVVVAWAGNHLATEELGLRWHDGWDEWLSQRESLTFPSK